MDWLLRRHWGDWWGLAVFVIVAWHRCNELRIHQAWRQTSLLNDYFRDAAFPLLLFLFILCASPFVQRVFSKTLCLQPQYRFALTALSGGAVLLWIVDHGKEIHRHTILHFGLFSALAVGLSALGWYLWIKWTHSSQPNNSDA